MNATVLIFLCGYKTQIQIFDGQISPGLTQPVNRVVSTTVYNYPFRLEDAFADVWNLVLLQNTCLKRQLIIRVVHFN